MKSGEENIKNRLSSNQRNGENINNRESLARHQ
jgi:hypothetical protein